MNRSIFYSRKQKFATWYCTDITYKITLLGFLEHYIAKTNRCFHIEIDEHGRKLYQPMHIDLTN